MNRLVKSSDLKEIESYLTYSDTAATIREFISWNGFAVGDVLIQIDTRQEDEIVQVSKNCPVPRKHKIVHIDELGIPWVKQVSVRGGLGKSIKPLIEISPMRYRFEIDPLRFEAEMLGFKYDPRIEYKRMRENNPCYGKDNE